jgi:hypothetical protein
MREISFLLVESLTPAYKLFPIVASLNASKDWLDKVFVTKYTWKRRL